MGGSSTAASVHTVVPDATVSLPSITIQHDLTGTATDWGTQYSGCKVTQLELNCSSEGRYLWANVDWVAQAATKMGFISTNAPVLPTTATATPYLFTSMTATFDSNSFRDGLTDLQFIINPDLKVWKDGSRTIPEPLDGDRMKYYLKFLHSPEDSTFWEEAAATGNTKDAVIKWTKSTNDYIELTISDLQVLYHEQKSPTTGKELSEEVICEARGVSFAIKDALADANYGD